MKPEARGAKMPLPFPKLKEKCATHVCLVDNRYGDERWEDALGMSREEKDRECREERARLEALYHEETEKARLNSLGGHVGVHKIQTGSFGVERRRYTIDERGIFVATDSFVQKIITSFRPIDKTLPAPKTSADFHVHALRYYKRLTHHNWGR
jgi:hypothetical protein